MSFDTLISADIKLTDTITSHIWYSAGEGVAAPIQRTIYDLDDKDGLESSVLISIFADRRITFTDDNPKTPGDRRGWWGDNTLEDGDRVGSKMWTLERAKLIDKETAPNIKAFLKEALQWLIDDGIAADIRISVTKTDALSMTSVVDIVKPGDEKPSRFSFIWKDPFPAIVLA